MKFTYTIGRVTESQNVYQRWHYMVRNRERTTWGQHLLLRRTAAHHVQPGRHRYVSITSYRPRLITDHANLVGGAKGLIDAMTQARLIDDDNDRAVTITYGQFLMRDSPLRGNRFHGKRLLVNVPTLCTVITISDEPL